MECLKTNGNDNKACKLQSKQYIACRMDKGLMTKEDLSHIGFAEADMKPVEQSREEIDVQDTQEARRKNGYVAGMGLIGKIRKDG